MFWLAFFVVVIAYGHTVITYTACPNHTDVFDAAVCPLCSIRMSRREEIDGYETSFEQGRDGGLFANSGIWEGE